MVELNQLCNHFNSLALHLAVSNNSLLILEHKMLIPYNLVIDDEDA